MTFCRCSVIGIIYMYILLRVIVYIYSFIHTYVLLTSSSEEDLLHTIEEIKATINETKKALDEKGVNRVLDYLDGEKK